MLSPSPGTPVLSCPAPGAHHSWKLAAWVESQKSMPITTLAVSPGARRSETTRLPPRPTSPSPANPYPCPPQAALLLCGCHAVPISGNSWIRMPESGLGSLTRRLFTSASVLLEIWIWTATMWGSPGKGRRLKQYSTESPSPAMRCSSS